MFPLTWAGYILCGGDFDSFEVTLADAVYNDPNLRAALCSGKKIHALFGMEMYPGKTYEDILASADTEFDMYTKGKQGVFGMIYGGDWNTLVGKFGLPPEVAQRAEEGFFQQVPRYPQGPREDLQRLLLNEAAGRPWLGGRVGGPGRLHRIVPGFPSLLHAGKQDRKGPL